MKTMQTTYRRSHETCAHLTLGTLVAVVVLTLVVLVHAFGSSVARGAGISAETFPASENNYSSKSVEVQSVPADK